MTLQQYASGSDSNLLTVQLEKLVYGGDALGRLPNPLTGTGGRAVFVPFALPGEIIKARLIEEKRGHVRAELVEVLEPSPERIPPKCGHFGACGGCHYQHLPYPSQLRVKAEILADQLSRIGKIGNPPVAPMVPSPNPWNYRNHVQFHLTREGKVGYVREHSRAASCRRGSQDVFAIRECHLPEGPLNEIWPKLEFDPGLPLERVSLRLGMEEDAVLILESSDPQPPDLELEAGLSVVYLNGGNLIVLAGDENLTISVNDRPFRVSAGSFFQVNTGMAGKMVDHLLKNLPVEAGATLLDVYCGVGLFSAFFAPRVKRVIGIESSPSACEDFVANLDEFENVELYEAPAEQVLPQLQAAPEAVIVDPPRAGLEKRALEALLAQAPERIAYVSCDPSTLSRDLARFIAGGYRLIQVTPFDLFPQTHSIESISILEKG